jgi:peptide/nickel transport system substrate-binding protein
MEVFGADNVWNTPAELEVPMPVGDPDGDLETINVHERTAELPSLAGDELEETVTTLSWAFNQTLPVIPLVTENGGFVYWTDRWEYPDREEAIWGLTRGREAMFATGAISASPTQ